MGKNKAILFLKKWREKLFLKYYLIDPSTITRYPESNQITFEYRNNNPKLPKFNTLLLDSDRNLAMVKNYRISLAVDEKSIEQLVNDEISYFLVLGIKNNKLKTLILHRFHKSSKEGIDEQSRTERRFYSF